MPKTNAPTNVPSTDAPTPAEAPAPEVLDPTSHDARREEEQRAAKRHRDARRVGRRVVQAISNHRRTLAVVALSMVGVAIVGGLAAAGPRVVGRLALRQATPLIAQALPTAVRATALTLGVPTAVATPMVLVARVFARAAR